MVSRNAYLIELCPWRLPKGDRQQIQFATGDGKDESRKTLKIGTVYFISKPLGRKVAETSAF